jgi:parallel beta-helix repeat protein
LPQAKVSPFETKASNDYPVHNLNTGLNYTTIQHAIDANETLDGHTIFVDAGTYDIGAVVVYKSLKIIGDGMSNTTIYGYTPPYPLPSVYAVFGIPAENVSISGFTIKHSPKGYYGTAIAILKNSKNDIVSNNNISFNCGIYLENTCNNTISKNIIESDVEAIYLTNASQNCIIDNIITNGMTLSNMSSDNTVVGNIMTGDDGIDIVDHSSNNILKNNTISCQYEGFRVSIFSNNNLLLENKISDSMEYGITVSLSNHTIISGNEISHNQVPIYIWNSMNNSIYHNNFRYNTNRVTCSNSTNSWDDGYPSSGNYWSDYNGIDYNQGSEQNISGSDGISDSCYEIDSNNIDHYPLMGMFYTYDISWVDPQSQALMYGSVTLISNSSVSDFMVRISLEHPEDKAIIFNVTGSEETNGFCRICIPTSLMNATYRVFVNGTQVKCYLLPCSNSTHSYLYFNYTHSTQEVIIIPEFPSFLILPLFMIATLLAVTVYRRKHTEQLAQHSS